MRKIKVVFVFVATIPIPNVIPSMVKLEKLASNIDFKVGHGFNLLEAAFNAALNFR